MWSTEVAGFGWSTGPGTRQKGRNGSVQSHRATGSGGHSGQLKVLMGMGYNVGKSDIFCAGFWGAAVMGMKDIAGRVSVGLDEGQEWIKDPGHTIQKGF